MTQDCKQKIEPYHRQMLGEVKRICAGLLTGFETFHVYPLMKECWVVTSEVQLPVA
jgi:hypothetical protein